MRNLSGIQYILLTVLIFILTGCGKTTTQAVYVGVKDERTATRQEVLSPGAQVYGFQIGNTVKYYALKGGTEAGSTENDNYQNVPAAESGGYPIQNTLEKGVTYEIEIDKNEIVSAKAIGTDAVKYSAAVEARPGLKTLKNFLATACQPLGTTLYVYGGGWDFQDTAAGNQARTIGVSPEWVLFYQSHDVDYEYREENKNGDVYYPLNAWNPYYYAGLDCSGFVGWTVYNTMYSESLKESGFVGSSSNMAYKFDKVYGFGKWGKPASSGDGEADRRNANADMRPGDIVSIAGHVYIVVGKCSDGSTVIIHSSVYLSRSGANGGGVTLSAIAADSSDSKDCEAYVLADYYNRLNSPEWAERYDNVMKPYETYLYFGEETDKQGFFTGRLKGTYSAIRITMQI